MSETATTPASERPGRRPRRDPGRAHPQALRRRDCARGRLAPPRARRGARPDRRQRRREVDVDQDPDRLSQARLRADLRQRRRGPAQVGDARTLARHRHRLPGPRARTGSVRLPQHVPQPRAHGRPRAAPLPQQPRDAEALAGVPRRHRRARPVDGCRGRTDVGRPASGDRNRAVDALQRQDHPARRAARCHGRAGGCADHRADHRAEAAGRRVDHRDRAQLRARVRDVRPRESASQRPDHARQADSDETSVAGAHVDRRRRVPRAAGRR